MKITRAAIEKFFSAKAYAVIGVSEDRKKFGNIVYRTMKQKEFIVYPVNPKLSEVEKDRCYSSLHDLPDDVKSVVAVVPPSVTERVLIDCVKKGITSVWMQPGAESYKAIEYAKQSNLAVIHRECILMYLEPVESFHALHRWIKKLLGVYPK
jgi:uncharacterized protein